MSLVFLFCSSTRGLVRGGLRRRDDYAIATQALQIDWQRTITLWTATGEIHLSYKQIKPLFPQNNAHKHRLHTLLSCYSRVSQPFGMLDFSCYGRPLHLDVPLWRRFFFFLSEDLLLRWYIPPYWWCHRPSSASSVLAARDGDYRLFVAGQIGNGGRLKKKGRGWGSGPCFPAPLSKCRNVYIIIVLVTSWL